MNLTFPRAHVMALFLFLAPATWGSPLKLGESVPASQTWSDASGKQHVFSDLRGKPTVLEWANFGCPFTQKHYSSGNMQNLQKTYTQKGVNWVTVISSAPGKQGYLTPQEAPESIRKNGLISTYVALDPAGTLGHLFGAETTPHIFILSASGQLVYHGAIDSIPSFDPADIPHSVNYISKSLDEILAQKPVSTPNTRSYGCSVKY